MFKIQNLKCFLSFLTRRVKAPSSVGKFGLVSLRYIESIATKKSTKTVYVTNKKTHLTATAIRDKVPEAVFSIPCPFLPLNVTGYDLTGAGDLKLETLYTL